MGGTRARGLLFGPLSPVRYVCLFHSTFPTYFCLPFETLSDLGRFATFWPHNAKIKVTPRTTIVDYSATMVPGGIAPPPLGSLVMLMSQQPILKNRLSMREIPTMVTMMGAMISSLITFIMNLLLTSQAHTPLKKRGRCAKEGAPRDEGAR
jgi:uncharacterized protein YybS (DUF2232 family)